MEHHDQRGMKLADEEIHDGDHKGGSRTCRVYSARWSVGGELERPDVLAKQNRLRDFADMDQSDRYFGGVLYHPIQLQGEWILTMHRPLKQEFLSRIGESGVEDLGDDEEPLAHSSAVLQLQDGFRFALLKGDRSAPGANDFHAFLSKWLTPPPKEGSRELRQWTVNPAVREDVLQRLERSSGVVSAELTVEAQQDLFSASDSEEPSPFSDAAESVEHKVSPNAAVTLGVKLDAKVATQQELQALRRATIKEVGRQHRKKRPGKVEFLDAEGRKEVVNLLKDQVSMDVKIDGPDPDNASFTTLATSLLRARRTIEDQVGLLESQAVLED